MTQKRKPTLLSVVVEQDQATLHLRVDHDILDFSGHFSHFPLLPGVTQIDWAVAYAKEFLRTPPSFKGMEVIKFQEPILPDSEVSLQLKWDDEKQKLHFAYTSQRNGAVVNHSTGKMKLGNASE